MNLTARVGESFRAEFSRQGTLAYVSGMLCFLVIGGLVFQGRLSPRWGMFLSPGVFMVLLFADNRRDFWKRLVFGFATYALFYTLIFVIPDRFGFLRDKPQLFVAFYVIASITTVILQFAWMRRFFPNTHCETGVEAKE